MEIYELIKLSIKSLFSFKFRSFLTMLGIIIGISSVVLISSIGAGFQGSLLGDITKSYANIININVNPNEFRNRELKRDYLFTNQDVENLSSIPNVETTYFTSNAGGTTKEGLFVNVTLEPATWSQIYKKQVAIGRNFTLDEYNAGENLAIVDEFTALKVGQTLEGSLGKTITYTDFEKAQDVTYTIIGVLAPEDADAKVDFGRTFLTLSAPYTSYYKNDQYKQIISLKVVDNKKIQETVTLIKSYLAKKSGNDNFYEVKPLNDQLSQVTGILDKVALFISFIAAISLIVGGIGVMNIMLVSVTERITEIGLRKAIGAKNKDILLQFLIESVILTLLGGIIGVAFGYLLAVIVGIFLKVTPVLKVSVLLVSLLVSMGTGLIFGIFPARKASKLSPMEALRTE